MTQTVHHPVAFNAGGSTANRPEMCRYDNNPQVAWTGTEYTVDTDDGEYRVRRNNTAGWDIYLANGVDLLPVAGGGHATGILNHDKAIGALLGDPHA